MSRKSYPNVNAANQYARDVVRGKIVACQFVIQACQRHLDDLMAEKSKSFRYRFDKDLAERAAKFIQLLPHTKGEWAFKRMPITLEPWQLFVICCAFGWVNKGTRLRRFREVYTEIPRKNGKSAISAGVALYCFACDNEFGAEVYSGATTEKQAWEVFRPARLMCKRTPMLTEAFGIEVNASNMNRPEDGARFEPLIGNPGDGSSPHCAVVDEYHEHATDALYTTMLTGMGARRQPLMWAITTAGYNIEGPCYDKRREVIEMLNGSVPNDELFGIIYTVDEGDDWTDPQVLEKANPNIGVSVYREFLLSQQQRAKNNARLANVFKTKHLNIWVSARSAYFNLVSWQSCEDKSLTLEQFEGQPCILAFDLARKLDMNSMARLYTREIDGKTHYYSVAPRFWVPYDTVYSVEKNEDRRTAERFQKWVEMGVLTVTDGAEVDYRYILEEAKAANKISPVSESPIDPFGATGLSHDLADEDLNPVTIVQNFANMSDPMKELEAAIESGRFHHDGNPIMTWCIGNVVGKNMPGNDDVVKPVKEQAENKIDGAVALIMAVGRAMLYEKEDTLSDHIEVINKILGQQQALAYDDPHGRLVIGGIGSTRAHTALVLGENILSCDTEKSIRERFSVYQVAGQRAGNDDDFGEATTTALRARTEDAFIARYRPMYIRQTGQATGAGCIARADFEARKRAARTDETTYVVQGWRQGNGTLWQPNQRVIVFDPVCGFDNTELLVSEVTFTQDQNGTLTEIRVGPPDAYLPEPEAPGARKKKKARVQEDPF